MFLPMCLPPPPLPNNSLRKPLTLTKHLSCKNTVYLYAINIQHLPRNYYWSLAERSEQKQVGGGGVLVFFPFVLVLFVCLMLAGTGYCLFLLE